MGHAGFKQHLHFVLLFQFAFPVVEGSGAGEDGHAGSELICQHFGGKILGGSFIGSGTQNNNSVGRIHKSTSVSRKKITISRPATAH
ncbi:hypothetical protein D3C76_959840 [compost metagenome]